MAKKATAKPARKSSGTTKRSTSAKSTSLIRTAPRKRSSSGKSDPSDAFVKVLQSPLVADLVAVAATAALAALAENGFSGDNSKRSRAGHAVKAAGKAAAAAVGRRLGSEFDEIRSAATAKRGGAK